MKPHSNKVREYLSNNASHVHILVILTHPPDQRVQRNAPTQGGGINSGTRGDGRPLPALRRWNEDGEGGRPAGPTFLSYEL
jgi:hypothetical protein